MKNIFRSMAAVIMMAMSLEVPAQPQAPAASPAVHPDNTVTFSLHAPEAENVKINAQFAPKADMTRGEDGLWSITLGPVAPDIYPYCFEVDGMPVMDPQCPDWFPNEGFKSSMLDVRGEGLAHELRSVPHGRTDYVTYWSETLGTYGNALVYTPPTYYAQPDRKYPVFYLISGTTDTEEVYFKVGKMNLILDNLIAEGKAKEMIIVLPYGNPSKYNPSETLEFGKGDVFSTDFLNDLMPYVEASYRTIEDRDSRAIGGFSRGGNQALSIGLNNLDKFSYLCSYSSFTSMDIPEVYGRPKKSNRLINLFWLGVGTDDFLYGNAKEYMEFLDSKGIRNVQYFTSDRLGHTWMNARHFLEKTFPLLFDKEASARAMKASRKEGHDHVMKASEVKGQRLTPEVLNSIFPQGTVSPEYNQDGSVTFRLEAAGAEKVELECQMFGGTRLMTRNEKGIWEITVTPEQPDIYPYAFIIDGTKTADPKNMHLFPNEGFKYSLCDVKGSKPDWQDLQDVPHGKVSYTWYTSSATGFDRPVCVYTPAGYDPASDERYPVLYLIHGMTDTYETWFKVGRINNILDNLIAEGSAEKMIVVMPYANPYPEMIRRGLAKAYDPMDTKLIDKEITESVIPFIEDNYKVIEEAEGRAIAGFSLGGRQALACGLGNPETFAYVCAFAPAVFGPEISANFENGTYADTGSLNRNLELLWLSCGTSDFLYRSSQELDRNLTDRGIIHKTVYSEGGHTWMNCRDYIREVCKLLFKKDFALGADISWITEMEARGEKLYNRDGQEREGTALMKELGLDAVRLRVWVDPSAHGGWCSKDDLLVKCLRAKALDMKILVDFHYSDWWADPQKQNIPAAWSGHSYGQMKEDLAAHTVEVLQLLKDNGVEPEWIQIGNETRNGFLWSVKSNEKGWPVLDENGNTTITESMGHAVNNPEQYAGLFAAGYDAAKSVFPGAVVMVHLDNGFDRDLYDWNLGTLKKNGAKWDMIGMSLYPYWAMDGGFRDDAETTIKDCLENIAYVSDKFGCEVMIVETGFYVDESRPEVLEEGRRQLAWVIRDCMVGEDGLSKGRCKGVFYWEPQCRPSQYRLGAFTQEGRPTVIMDAFTDWE